jgi:O-antigen/teichoic acid export membrane protein
MSRDIALRTSKNTLMLVVGTLARMVAGFAFVLYSADSLGVEGFGKFSIASLYFELFLGLAATAMGTLLTRDIARWRRAATSLFGSAMVGSLGMCLLAPLAMFPLAWGFGYSNDTIQAIGLAAIAMFPASICVLAEAAFVARERAEFVTMGSIVESLFRVISGIVLLKLGFGIIALIMILLVSRVLLLVAYLPLLLTIMPAPWGFSWRRTARFAKRWRVFAAENWMAAIYTNLDVLVLSALAGESAAGVYTAAGKLVRLGTVFTRSYTTAVFPVMARLFGESQDSFQRLYHQTIRFMCAMALPAIIGVSVLADRIVELLYNDQYADAAAVLRVLMWVLLVEFLNPFLSHALFAQGRQHHSMRVAAISLFANSIASVTLVYYFGAVGAAVACVFSGAVATCCYMNYAMSRTELIETATIGLRVLVAACGMGVVLQVVHQQSWVLIGFCGVVIYFSLAYLVHAIRREDLDFFLRA